MFKIFINVFMKVLLDEIRTKLNAFTLTYSPIELATIAVLSISNPITLVQLYRRHKRKLALRQCVFGQKIIWFSITLNSCSLIFPLFALHYSRILSQVPPVEDYGSGSALKARSQWQRYSKPFLAGFCGFWCVCSFIPFLP